MRDAFACWCVFMLSACSALRDDGAVQRDWDAILAHEYAVPVGLHPFDLLLELSDLTGSPDPHLRDDCAYGIAAQWIVRQRLLEPDELRELARRWTANLKQGLGETNTDGVLLRSFSALSLSLIAARDLQTPFLEQREVSGLLECALAYGERERDLRDFDARCGWIHATAHTADWLKFLARNPHVERRQLNAILEAIGRKLATPMERAYSMGEDERLARAAIAVVAREEHEAEAFESFLDALLSTLTQARGASPVTAESIAVQQNILHFLRAMHAALASVEDLPPHARRARDATLRALARG